MKTIAKIQLLIMTIVMSFALTSCSTSDSEPSITSPASEIMAAAGDTFTFTMPEEMSRYTQPRLNIWPKA